MEEHSKGGQAEIRILGSPVQHNTIPAEILAQTIEGVQQLVWLLAAAQEHKTISRRFKPDQDLRSRYTVACGLPESGSYTIPISITHLNPPQQLSLHQEPVQVLSDLHQIFTSLRDSNTEDLETMLTDSSYRVRVLQQLNQFLPRPGADWSMGFKLTSGNEPLSEEVVVDSRIARTVEETIAKFTQVEAAVMTVTGEFVEVNFSEYKLVIKYPPTNQNIQCVYLPEIEDTILEKRRELIQVTGQFTLDATGNPSKLTDVYLIQPVDLSTMTFPQIQNGERTIVCNPPLVFEPTLDDESSQLYVISDDQLNINVFAPTRDQLAEELAEFIFALWDNYAQETDHNLSEKALELKQILLQQFKEV